MKKNSAMRLAAVLLVATLLSVCTVSGTFAKYTSSATGTDSASVAKWSFTVNETEIATKAGETSTIDFNLFGDNDKIAPGMSGSVTLTLKNTSEVATVASVSLSEENEESISIKYSTTQDGTYSDLSSFSFEDVKLAAEGEETVTIYWKWESTNDTADTEIGILAREAETVPSITVTATVTASQAS